MAIGGQHSTGTMPEETMRLVATDVYRNFPTSEALMETVAAPGLEALVTRAERALTEELLGAWLLLRGDGDAGRLMQPGTPKKGAAAAVPSGSVLACCSFVGFETSVNAAEETRDPRRSRPRTLFGALADGERRPCRILAMGVSAAACPGPPCGG
ncbi:hypothetical protein ABZ519_37585 [Streptomyces collinus]